ncbi:thioredoxin family protein [Flammeovirga sp. SJP92]|uniref:thioredoxin family protein n=1 Tax=Flammeovirga sp. SJP92 TaxID=1775430 RepID=UPI000788F7AB|nr:thioredoxin family protein [Flammeovirga sp. SJP92]KXX66957.1 hypothetical protein AVL50_28695 [Flammeovirga sp. SJP92]
MKKITLSFLLSVLTISLYAQGIVFFEGTWAEAKAEAKKTNKHIFVDAYTTWCGPCKYLKKSVFPEKVVGEVYNSNYISIAIDMEKGEGVDFAKEFDVKVFPTLLYFTPDAQLAHKNVGATKPKEFAEWGKDALDPSKQLYTLKRKVENATNPTKEDLRSYLMMAYKSYAPDKTTLDKWLGKLNDADFKEDENLELIAYAATMSNVSDEVVVVFKANDKEAVAQLEGETLEGVYGAIASTSLRSIYKTASEADWEKGKKEVVEVLGENNVALAVASMDAAYYISKGKWQIASMSVDNAIMLYEAAKDPYLASRLNSYAWKFYEAGVEAKYMKKALTWINRSVLIEKGFANLDTQAHILFQLEKNEKARKVAEEAIKLGKKVGEDVSETEDLLKKINAM